MTRRRRPLRRSALAATLTAGFVVLTAVPAAAVTGSEVASGDTTYAYTAQLIIGDHERGCSGVLVDSEWLLTAASCFADDPATSLAVPSGKPARTTTATIGRSDLTGTGGAVRQVVQLVPRTDRDVVLARLNRPVTGVAPIALATAAPTTGEELRLAGYGRTKDEWAPLKLHTGAFSVDASATGTVTLTGKDGVAACMGDTGGPMVRLVAGTPQLAALTSQSYQGGCFGTDAGVTGTGAIASRVDDLSAWVSATVDAVPVTDFNCDGVEDIAISDPGAAVGGDAGAGLVRIVYGGGKGTAEINQDLDWVSGGAEAGDGFGEAIATFDYDEDGCTDLAVGTPGDDIGTVADAGMVDILHGATGGLGTGTVQDTHLEQGMGTGALAASTSESGDRMGQALAAGATAAGEPFLVIGVPGESIGTVAKAGNVIYLHGTTNIGFNQDSTGVSGGVEAGDGFGTTVAADANHIAVGTPHDTIGVNANAGNINVFSHTLNSENRPTPLFGLDQDLATVSGDAEPGDLFGQSLALVPYRAPGDAAATESILAVGSPGESLTFNGVDLAGAGRVLAFQITAAGAYSQIQDINEGTSDDDVSGTAEPGDHFGQTLAAVNTAPRSVSTTGTLKLAVGIPDEAIGTTANAGAVQTFSLLGAPGANHRWLEAGDGDGIPGTPGASEQLGSSLHYTGSNLYVGMPNGPSAFGTLYSLPLSNVTAGGTVAPVTTYQPGTGGLPAAGADFGYAAR